MKAILERISSLHVAVIGDIMLDHYLWGEVSRISPEAPVPVLEAQRDTYGLGGAGNVARNLRAIGARVTLLGTTGEDEPGDRIAGLLNDEGITLPSFCRCTGLASMVKTRILARHQQLCRVDREDRPDRYPLLQQTDSEAIGTALDGVDALILSDYGKGTLTSPLIEVVQGLNIPLVTMDPKPRRRLDHRDMDLITPNRGEALALAGMSIEAGADFPAEAVCRRIWELHRPRLLAITLGADGMLLSREGRIDQHLPTSAREVFDVSGAGDTVIATLTAALAAGAEWTEAATFANLAAGVVVAKIGAAVALPEEILRHGTSATPGS